MATGSRPAVRRGLTVVGPLAFAAVITSAALLVIGAAWPSSHNSVAVSVETKQAVEPPITGNRLIGVKVVALREATLERAASGALNATGQASLRLRPAKYLVCASLPVSVQLVGQLGSPVSAEVGPIGSDKHWSCQPVTVGQAPPASVTLNVGSAP